MHPNEWLAARIVLERHRYLIQAAEAQRLVRRGPRPHPGALRRLAANALGRLAHRLDPERVPAPRSGLAG